MIQGYFLSILYLSLSALMFLENKYRLKLSLILRLSSFLKTNRKALYLFTLFGFLCLVMLLFFPIAPGPMILGDLVPSLMIFYEILYFFIAYSRVEGKGEREYINFAKEGRKVTLGWISLIVAAVHFAFPSFVLL